MQEILKTLDTIKVPVLPLRGITLFPYTTMHLDAGRQISVDAIEYALQNNVQVLLLTQIDPIVENPNTDDFYKIGTLARVKQLVRLPNKAVRVLIETDTRASAEQITRENDILFTDAEILTYNQPINQTKKLIAQIRSLKDIYSEYFRIIARISPDVINNIIAINDIEKLTDMVASSLFVDYDDKQYLLEILDPKKRLNELLKIIATEIDLLNIEIEIQGKIKKQIDKNQREYYLKEQIKVINEELGESEDVLGEAGGYYKKLEKLNLPKESNQKVKKEIDRFSKMPSYSHEMTVIRSYLDTVFDLPWNRSTNEKIDIKKCTKILESEHYGLEKVKEKIIEYLSAKKMNSDIKSQIICLVGPPGVGKTSIVRSIAKAIGRKYQRMSLGGVRDEAEIRGHRKTYVGSMPGKIISAIRTSGVNNPLILLDEIDKLGSDFKGDPSSALLEVLDKEQNFSFTDHYIDLPFDLSNVLFITTANNLDTIPSPLLDRMEVVNISGYTRQEKFHIANDYLLKKQYLEHKVTKKLINITDSAIYSIIDFYVREAGVRNLERNIINLIRKAQKDILLNDLNTLKIDDKNIEAYLGKKKYIVDKKNQFDEVGAALGLAWTAAGGDTLFCEAAVTEGTGKIEATGSLGEVMKESTKIAVTYIRTIYDKLGLDKKFYKTKDIHIHFPDGATPKDGPSAGITIALAVTSALTGRKIRCDVAMTGEISIRGKVLPIGGLKEKAISAHRVSVFNIIIPKENEKDLEEIPKEILPDFNFMPVSTFKEVLEIALLPKEEPKNIISVKDTPNGKFEVYTDKIQ
jgi:ATP-dependent Lon protease